LAKLIRRAENDFEEEHLGAADFCASATLRKWPSLNKEHHQPNQHRAARARNASITCSMAGFGGGARYPKRPSGRASSGWFEVRQKHLRGKPLLGLLRKDMQDVESSTEFVGDFHAPALSGLKLAIQTLQNIAFSMLAYVRRRTRDAGTGAAVASLQAACLSGNSSPS
jgi:hypothetical protein